MRIVYVITGLSVGGAEMMLLKVLTLLDRQQFEPYVISLTDSGDIATRITALNIPVISLNMESNILSLFGVASLVRLLKRLQPDIVHTWMYHADLLGGLGARLAGTPAVGWCIRNSDLDRHKTKSSTRVVVKACAWFSRWVPRRILSCSHKARHLHEAWGYAPEKMVVVPNGFDLSLFKPDARARHQLRLELGLDEKTPLVGLIGRFDPQKNHAGFFRAAALVVRHMPHIHFVLAGRGVDRGNLELKSLLQKGELINHLHFLGLRDDMPTLMAALDVLVSSSSYGEAFPNVLGEAMACGVPCVVTDVGDSAYIVGDTGQVVQADDDAALASGIMKILSLPLSEKKTLGERARARILENFELKNVVKQYEAFYESLLLPSAQPDHIKRK